MFEILGVLAEVGALGIEPPAGVVGRGQGSIPGRVHRKALILELAHVAKRIDIKIAVHGHGEGLANALIAEWRVVGVLEAEEHRDTQVAIRSLVDVDIRCAVLYVQDALRRNLGVMRVDAAGDELGCHLSGLRDDRRPDLIRIRKLLVVAVHVARVHQA